jgi:hypothetical protein
VLDEYIDVGPFGEERFFGPSQISLTVRSVLEKLAETREISPRRRDVAVCLDAVRPQSFSPLWYPPVRRRTRDEDVIAGLDG